MKRLALIFVLFVFVLSATELRQLTKLPALIEHFSHHRHCDGELSFFQFLALHYSHGSDHTKTDDHNGKLPFKTHSASSGVGSQPGILTQSAYSLWTPEPAYFSPFTAAEDDLIGPFSSGIWQPPKLS